MGQYSIGANSQIANASEDAVLTAGTQLRAANVWQTKVAYDANGNVIQQASGFGDAIGTRTTSLYNTNNTLHQTIDETNWVPISQQIAQNNALQSLGVEGHVNISLAIASVSTYTTDGSGRVESLSTVSLSQYSGAGPGQDSPAGQSSTTNYTYSYNGFGEVTSISAQGANDSSGTSSITYNADGQETSIDQGQGNGMGGPEISNYILNSTGQIVFQQHLDGQFGDAWEEIAYDNNSATGSEVGETGVYANGESHTYLDGGAYASVQQITPSQAGTGQSSYTAAGGETLQEIAQNVYGNSALWYVIANANGLAGNATLKAGEQLSLPGANPSGQSNSTTTKPYSSGEIEGGNLPNVNTPAPSGGGCGVIGLIIVIIVIIIVDFISEGANTSANGEELGAYEGAEDAASQVLVHAAEGFAINVGTQEVGKALGDGKAFSLREAVAAGLASGVAPGGTDFGFGTVGNYVANGVVQNVAQQGANMAVGLQQRFDWAQAAASGVSAGVTGPLGSSVAGGVLNSFVENGVQNLLEPASRQTPFNLRDSLTNVVANDVSSYGVGQAEQAYANYGNQTVDQTAGAESNDIASRRADLAASEHLAQTAQDQAAAANQSPLTTALNQGVGIQLPIDVASRSSQSSLSSGAADAYQNATGGIAVPAVQAGNGGGQGGYAPGDLMQAGLPPYAQFIDIPLDRNGNPIVGAATGSSLNINSPTVGAGGTFVTQGGSQILGNDPLNTLQALNSQVSLLQSQNAVLQSILPDVQPAALAGGVSSMFQNGLPAYGIFQASCRLIAKFMPLFSVLDTSPFC